MTSDGPWSAARAWDLGILRYDDDGEVYWAGEGHLYTEDEPYGDVEHDHKRGITHG